MNTKPQRLRSLDSLRGLAALVVLLLHALLYQGFMEPEEIGAAIAQSPLAFAISGGSAVMVFFVLSGFVLGEISATSAFKSNPKTWLLARLLRLYLPIWPILLITILLHVLVLRETTWSLDTAVRLLLDTTLIFGHGNILGGLWSLRWEIIFSIAVPVLGLVSNKSIALNSWALFACIFANIAGNFFNIGALQYLPVLLSGFFLQRLIRGNQKIGGWLGSRTIVQRWLWVGTASTLLSAELQIHYLVSLEGARVDLSSILGQPLGVLGAIGLTALLSTPRSETQKPSPLMSWLASISYSLYLVHQPCLELANFLVSENKSSLALSAGIALSLLVSHLYWQFIEGPAHRFARKVGRGNRE